MANLPLIPSPTQNALIPSVAPPLTYQLPPLNPVATDEDEIQRLRSTGAGVGQIHNPFLRGFARTADVVGSVFAPGLATAIPGTTLHHNMLVNQAQQNLEKDQAEQQAQANLEQTAANTDYLKARPEIEQSKLDQKTTQAHDKNIVTLAKNGQMYDENGDIVDDPTSEAYHSRMILDDVRQSRQELQDAQTAFNKAKTDPNSPLFQQTQARLRIAEANAQAANTRAGAYMGRYLQSAYNEGLHGDVLPAAPVVTDENGNQTVVGTGNAANAVKSQANVAQFNDVYGALGNLESSAHSLVNSGGKLNSPGVAAALAQPKGTLGQWLQGAGAKANLTPEERNYVTAIAAFRENLQALRKSAGGTATDASVDRLEQMAPNASTPDLDYLLRQTGQIRATTSRLGRGVTTVKGGLKINENAPTSVSDEPLGTTNKPDGIYEMNGKRYRVQGGKVYAH